MRLDSATASATFSLTSGARLASLVVFGHELLITADDNAFGWGSFPMVPYAGRVAEGSFTFAGSKYSLPITMQPHAIHGTAWNQWWERLESDGGRGVMRTKLGPPWQFGGSVTQEASLHDDRLELTLIVTAGSVPMPAMAGWHPWFRRGLLSGEEASFTFDAESMYELDTAAIPTGVLIEPPPGPWDNCFTGLRSAPRITWADAVELTLTSSCTDWVLYDQPTHAICIEPQSAAPDSFNRTPHILAPGESLEATFNLSWRRPDTSVSDADGH